MTTMMATLMFPLGGLAYIMIAAYAAGICWDWLARHDPSETHDTLTLFAMVGGVFWPLLVAVAVGWYPAKVIYFICRVVFMRGARRRNNLAKCDVIKIPLDLGKHKP